MTNSIEKTPKRTREIDQIASTSARGSSDLFIGQTLSGIISLAGMLLIARFLGPSLFGQISVVLILPSLCFLFQDWGVSHAITRYVAMYNNQGEPDRARSIIIAGVSFEILSGLLLSFLSWFLTSYFAMTVLNAPELESLILLSSLIVIGQTLFAVGKSTLLGVDQTVRIRSLLVFDAILLVVPSVIFVIIGYSLTGAIIGRTFGTLATGLISLVLIFQLVKKDRCYEPQSPMMYKSDLKRMLEYGLPIYFSVLAGGFLLRLYNLIAISSLSDWVLGNYFAAIYLASFMTFFSSPVQAIIFPTFSKIDPKTNKDYLETLYVLGTKYTSILIMPIVFLLMLLSNSVMQMLLGPDYSEAGLYFSFALLPYILTVEGSFIIGGFLRGQGKTGVYFGMHFAQLATGVLLAITFTQWWGVVGLLIASFLATLVSISTGVIWVGKRYGFYPDILDSLKIICAAGISWVSGYSVMHFLGSFNLVISILSATTVFVVIYLLIFSYIGILTNHDFDNLDFLCESQGKATPFLQAFVRLGKRLSRNIESE